MRNRWLIIIISLAYYQFGPLVAVTNNSLFSNPPLSLCLLPMQNLAYYSLQMLPGELCSSKGFWEQKLYLGAKPQSVIKLLRHCTQNYVETPKINVSGKKSLIASQYDFLSLNWCQLNIFCIMNCWLVLNNLPFITCVPAPSHTLSKPSECVPFEWSK